MATPRWDQRFFATTRGRILAVLRRAAATVDELAGTLGITDNAVRSQLATLERDGLVAPGESRRGVSKPSTAYVLTIEAERLFARGYAPVLAALLAEMSAEYGDAQAGALLRAAGRRLAAGEGSGDLSATLDSAVQVLNDLGGCAEWRVDGDRVVVQGYGCPLAEVAAQRPEICAMTEAFVAALTGLPMREACTHGERPRCAFAAPLPSTP